MVILVALRWGVWEATAVTVASFLFLDYFFTAPLFSLRMGQENWIALGTFEFVGLIVGRLSARERQQARLATEERNNMTRLYELSRFALQLDRRYPPEQQIARFIQDAIGLTVSRFTTQPRSEPARPGTITLGWAIGRARLGRWMRILVLIPGLAARRKSGCGCCGLAAKASAQSP